MGLRPARSQVFTSNTTPRTIDMMSQPELAKLKKDSHVVTIQHRTSASQPFRLVKENIPAAMLKAFSGYCSASLTNDTQIAFGNFTKSSMISVTGGVFGAVKAVIEFMLNYCNDKKKAMPEAQGSPLRFWLRLHEAAEILRVDVLRGAAMVEARMVCEEPLGKENVHAIVGAFHFGRRYNTMVLDNLTAAFFGWHADYDLDSELVTSIKKIDEETFNLLHERIHTQLKQEEELRLQWAAEDTEKRRKEEEAQMKQLEAVIKDAADAEGARKAARAGSFASIAARAVTPPGPQAKPQETVPARPTRRPRLVSSTKPAAGAPEARKVEASAPPAATTGTGLTWAKVASHSSK